METLSSPGTRGLRGDGATPHGVPLTLAWQFARPGLGSEEPGAGLGGRASVKKATRPDPRLKPDSLALPDAGEGYIGAFGTKEDWLDEWTVFG